MPILGLLSFQLMLLVSFTTLELLPLLLLLWSSFFSFRLLPMPSQSTRTSMCLVFKYLCLLLRPVLSLFSLFAIIFPSRWMAKVTSCVFRLIVLQTMLLISHV